MELITNYLRTDVIRISFQPKKIRAFSVTTYILKMWTDRYNAFAKCLHASVNRECLELQMFAQMSVFIGIIAVHSVNEKEMPPDPFSISFRMCSTEKDHHDLDVNEFVSQED